MQTHVEAKMTLGFEQVVESVMELPFEQQAMLQEIIAKRHIEAQRAEIAHDAQESLALFRSGQLRPQPAETILAELRQALDTDE